VRIHRSEKYRTSFSLPSFRLFIFIFYLFPSLHSYLIFVFFLTVSFCFSRFLSFFPFIPYFLLFLQFCLFCLCLFVSLYSSFPSFSLQFSYLFIYFILFMFFFVPLSNFLTYLFILFYSSFPSPLQYSYLSIYFILFIIFFTLSQPRRLQMSHITCDTVVTQAAGTLEIRTSFICLFKQSLCIIFQHPVALKHSLTQFHRPKRTSMNHSCRMRGKNFSIALSIAE
jgi:hypothetical protein